MKPEIKRAISKLLGEVYEVTQRPVTRFEVLDHGVDGAQYFPGCGGPNHPRGFEDCFVGAGEDSAEAVEDAVEMASQLGWEFTDAQVEEMKQGLGDATVEDTIAQYREPGDEDDSYEDNELHYYVSIHVA
jgi:hypothetical protein